MKKVAIIVLIGAVTTLGGCSRQVPRQINVKDGPVERTATDVGLQVASQDTSCLDGQVGSANSLTSTLIMGNRKGQSTDEVLQRHRQRGLRPATAAELVAYAQQPALVPVPALYIVALGGHSEKVAVYYRSQGTSYIGCVPREGFEYQTVLLKIAPGTPIGQPNRQWGEEQAFLAIY